MNTSIGDLTIQLGGLQQLESLTVFGTRIPLQRYRLCRNYPI